MIKNLLIVIQLLMLCQLSPVMAANDEPVDDEAEDSYTPVTSIETFNRSGPQTANSLGMAAEYATNHGNYEQAIKLCERALERDYNDIDVHMAYAKVLQEKLYSQKEPDHKLLNDCIREWLIVYRTEVGDEKGLSFHGINPLGHLYEDEDRSIPARSHLVKLTGRAPRPWETDTKFLKWVNRPSTEVAGRIINKQPSDTKATPNKVTKVKTETIE